MFLPVLGGKPSVWNTCLFFFQTFLLGGYLMSHLLTSHAKRVYLFQTAALAAGAFLLPIQLRAGLTQSIPTDANPAWWLLGALIMTVGLPFIALAANGPLLTYWFARLAPHRDPYFLYAASNAGSFLALFASPLLFDPRAGLAKQAWSWGALYCLLLPMVLICGWLANRAESDPVGQAPAGLFAPSDSRQPPVRWRERLAWLGLAFVPASLMMGATSYIASDIATIPLFWVLPLGLYLLSFVIAFAEHARGIVRFANRAAPILTLVLIYVLLSEANDPPWILLALHLVFLFFVALALHGRLASLRPASDRLTEFFLWLATGGMLAGFFNALLAPALFNRVAEYPIAIVLAALLSPGFGGKTPPRPWQARDLLSPIALGLLTIALSRLVPLLSLQSVQLRPALVFGLPVAAAYTLVDRRVTFALALAALIGASAFYPPAQGNTLYRSRNFFGISRVTLDSSGKFRRLVHGNTLHGLQAIAQTGECEPLAYYHRAGPLGHIFEAFHQRAAAPRVAVVGLGLGSMICYARPEEAWDFYEIDPAVTRIAGDTNYFSYLRNAPIPDFQIIMGDARLRLARAQSGQYGLIVLDAFSSDAIPVHLLSLEAVQLYLSKLAPGGLLAFHISNRYVDLEPVLAGLGRALHLTGVTREDTDERLDLGIEPSQWAVLARSRVDLGRLGKDARWLPLDGAEKIPTWTDDFSDVLSIFRWK